MQDVAVQIRLNVVTPPGTHWKRLESDIRSWTMSGDWISVKLFTTIGLLTHSERYTHTVQVFRKYFYSSVCKLYYFDCSSAAVPPTVITTSVHQGVLMLDSSELLGIPRIPTEYFPQSRSSVNCITVSLQLQSSRNIHAVQPEAANQTAASFVHTS